MTLEIIQTLESVLNEVERILRSQITTADELRQFAKLIEVQYNKIRGLGEKYNAISDEDEAYTFIKKGVDTDLEKAGKIINLSLEGLESIIRSGNVDVVTGYFTKRRNSYQESYDYLVGASKEQCLDRINASLGNRDYELAFHLLNKALSNGYFTYKEYEQIKGRIGSYVHAQAQQRTATTPSDRPSVRERAKQAAEAERLPSPSEEEILRRYEEFIRPYFTEKVRKVVDEYNVILPVSKRTEYDNMSRKFEDHYKVKNMGIGNAEELMERPEAKLEFKGDGYGVYYFITDPDISRYILVLPALRYPAISGEQIKFEGYGPLFGINRPGTLKNLIYPAFLDQNYNLLAQGRVEIE